MNDARYGRWVKASHALGKLEPFMVTIAQGLGRLDCQLLTEDHRFVALSQTERESIQESVLLSERLTLSYLWVLGAYELVRTADQRVRQQQDLVSNELASAISQLKARLARLRMPLAKMEAASSYRGMDYPIAYPGLHREHGIALQVAPQVFITRRELGDALLSLLEDLRNADPAFATHH